MSLPITDLALDSLMAEVITEANRRSRIPSLLHYQTPDGIVSFTKDVIRVENVAPYQEEIMSRFVSERRVAVRAPHGVGKTALASWCILWLMTVFPTDVKVPATASAWRQLSKFLFPEIRLWAQRANWAAVGLDLRLGRELLGLSIKLPQKEAFAVASDNPALIEGAHASVMGYIFDEAKAIPNPTWDAAEGAFATGDVYALAISTPGDPQGRFYDIHSRKPGYEDWWTRHVTLDEAIAAGRVNPEWVEQRRQQWGENSAVYQNRVLGEFATMSDDGVIPLAWVEAAIERWRECDGVGEGRISYGVDPARMGEDKTAISKLHGNVIEWIRYTTKEDTMQTVGRVLMAVEEWLPDIRVYVDAIGLGAGVYDRLAEQGKAVEAVNVGTRTKIKDTSGTLEFVNLRSALWWALRDWLDPAQDRLLALPPDDLLIGDLTAPKWFVTSTGKIKVDSKEDMRKRIGRSTDSADTVMLALSDRVTIPHTEGVTKSRTSGMFQRRHVPM